MNNSTSNTARSLEMVVSAPIEACVQALQRLEKKGGVFSREIIVVKTRWIRNDHYEFVIRLQLIRGKTRITTPIRGSLRYDAHFHTTTLIGEVPPIHGRMFLVGFLLVTFLLFFATPMAIFNHLGVVFIMIVFLGAPLIFWLEYKQDRTDTQRVLTMVARALNGAAYRDQQHKRDNAMDDSPFYDDDQSSKGKMSE